MEKGWMDRSLDSRGIGGILLVSLVWAGIPVTGCGGSAGSAPGTEVNQGDTIQRPPDPIVTDPQNTFNVTISAAGSLFPVDKLEIEFNRRRGIHEFYGFYRDKYSQLDKVPFRDLQRVDFLGQMPAVTFDQATLGKENLNLRLEHAFQVRFTFKDGRQEDFFAFIPKFRGEKDLQLWEFSMNSNRRAFDYIEFNR